MIELESEMFTLKMDDVLKLATDMKLGEASIKDKSRFVILKNIRQAMEEKVASLTEKAEIVAYLEGIKAFLGPPPLEESSDPPESSEKSPAEEPEGSKKSPEETQVLEVQGGN